jgi:Berberine and berberine like
LIRHSFDRTEFRHAAIQNALILGLVQIKRKFDPANFFHLNQNIPSNNEDSLHRSQS